MTESKYGKYIVSKMKPTFVSAPWAPKAKDVGDNGDKMTRMAWLDDEVIKGAFYVECVWFWPWHGPYDPDAGPRAHKHDYDEVLAFYGTKPNDPWDLGAEAEFWLEDEKHILTRSCLIFVPTECNMSL